MATHAQEFRALTYDHAFYDTVKLRLLAERDVPTTRTVRTVTVDGREVMKAVLEAMSWNPAPHTEFSNLVACWDTRTGEERLNIDARMGEQAGTVDLRFPDGSSDRYGRPGLPASGGVDMGPLLLEPITVHEIRGVERLLGELERAIERGSLSDFNERRIVAMADVIREAQIEAEPDDTPRWRVIGAVRNGLRYALKDLPRDGLALVKFVEILDDMGWTDAARNLL